MRRVAWRRDLLAQEMSKIRLLYAMEWAGQQERALAAFKRAHELTLPNQFKLIRENLSSRPAFKRVIEDKAFVSRVAGS